MNASIVAGSAARTAIGGRAAEQLRTVLRIDGWSTAVFGVVLLAAGRPFVEVLGLPLAWSVPFGIAMLGGAAALGLIAGYPAVPVRYTALVVTGNALSCVALVVLVFAGPIPLTGLGTAFLLSGAVVVAVYAGLEFLALRKAMAR
ncbi:hypothetical protein [Nocardiopsis tropica]|jgi:hypothetical protein|uniref:Integral membrane protein n=1 Tax=Nocardiopsis tropica TaxID=109330 RepID=A0ABU7KXZ1_9ACTN|nr:hypothetical protein [Nocardiopsis umidischolae]MEE2054140.1 hypothetical protein [Nocardiopsis umidischolae]